MSGGCAHGRKLRVLWGPLGAGYTFACLSAVLMLHSLCKEGKTVPGHRHFDTVEARAGPVSVGSSTCGTAKPSLLWLMLHSITVLLGTTHPTVIQKCGR